MPPDPSSIIVALALAAVAVLYASVGHGGASSYLAVLALAGVAPADLRPTGLVLNLMVSAVATFHFARAGYFRWTLFWPFALFSIPAAFIGGTLPMTGRAYELLLGAVLLLSAHRILRSGPRRTPGAAGARPDPEGEGSPDRPSLPPALLAGAGIGLLSGLVGVGGGIFLSPLLILAGWATTRESAAVAGPFILLNSAAGLGGQLLQGVQLPPSLPFWLLAVAGGGLTGALFGSRHASPATLRRLLGVVLLVAGTKLILF